MTDYSDESRERLLIILQERDDAIVRLTGCLERAMALAEATVSNARLRARSGVRKVLIPSPSSKQVLCKGCHGAFTSAKFCKGCRKDSARIFLRHLQPRRKP